MLAVDGAAHTAATPHAWPPSPRCGRHLGERDRETTRQATRCVVRDGPARAEKRIERHSETVAGAARGRLRLGSRVRRCTHVEPKIKKVVGMAGFEPTAP